MKKKFKSIKVKLYHKLINNKLIYDNKPLNRYNNNVNKISNMSSNKKENLLSSLKDKIKSIKNCELKNNATNLVFSDGNPSAKIMIIGEGPGANEDKEGKPFVGRAGKLLDKMLDSIKLNRKNVYISNVVNFRPPENRKPTDEEIKRYLPFLERHIEIIKPSILLLLGSTALNAIIGNEIVISKARGKWLKKKIGKIETTVIASFHPAFLMRQPEQKKYAWEDLKMIRKKISELKINLNG
ncbi:uracil-DNA glycosylase [Pelagibacteraceae bacterium]|nr:uracil-DNA glycosylase [Pelagibacteraceae bacterium]